MDTIITYAALRCQMLSKDRLLYDINSGLIAAFQLISMVIAIEVGYRMGLGRRDSTSEAVVSEANPIGTAYLLAQARK